MILSLIHAAGLHAAPVDAEFSEHALWSETLTRNVIEQTQGEAPTVELLYVEQNKPKLWFRYFKPRLQLSRVIYAQATPNSTSVLHEEGDQDELTDEFSEDFEDEFTDPSTSEIFDPLSGYNRVMTDFNDWLFLSVLDPVARGYRWAVPEGGRLAVNRFFDNLLFPVRVVNNVLQLKLLNAGEETLRFTINTTIGLLGFFNPAKAWFGFEEHDEDFGQTLGYYGVAGGFHIVLPFFGPSNLRDTVGRYPDQQLDPLHRDSLIQQELNRNRSGGLVYYPDFSQELGVKVVEIVNETSLHIGEYQSLKKDALDWYLFLRDFYEQNRVKKISE